MATKTNEVRLLLRQFIMRDPDVKALVGGNVFGTHLEDADAQTVLQDSPLVVFEFLSGFQRWYGAVATQTIEVYGYSKRSLDEASEVYDAVNELLQHSCVKVTGIDLTGLTRESQRPVDGYNDVLAAWFVRGRWLFNTV